MIVIDPVLTDTAKLADFHLRVRPGTDAWCLAAMVGVLVQEDLIDHEFLAAHASGVEAVLEAFASVDVPRYAGHCGVDETMIRAASRRIAGAESVSAFEDLGIQQGAQQHAVLLPQPDAVDLDRELRQSGRDAPAHVVREPVPRPAGAAHARYRRARS